MTLCGNLLSFFSQLLHSFSFVPPREPLVLRLKWPQIVNNRATLGIQKPHQIRAPTVKHVNGKNTFKFLSISKLLYFEWSPLWHFKAPILTYILSIIIPGHPLAKTTVHGMLWFLSKPTRLYLGRNTTSIHHITYVLTYYLTFYLRSCTCGWGPAVPTEICRSQLRSGSAGAIRIEEE